jgi:hypothetical protein
MAFYYRIKGSRIVNRLDSKCVDIILANYRMKIIFDEWSSLIKNIDKCQDLDYCFPFMIIYRMSQEERSVFWEVIISVILRKTFYMNMCPIPKGSRYLARSILNLPRNIFLPSLSVSNHNSQLTFHTNSYASGIGALQ